MKKVQLSSLNIEKLSRLYEIEGGEARLYRKFNKLIKVYNPDIDRLHRMHSLEMISDLKIKNVIVPQAILLDEYGDRKASGCIMKYYKNAKKLKEFFIEYDREKDYRLFLFILCNASMTLNDIHNHGLVCGDINMGNILYMPNYNHLFCDFDGVSINNMGPESALLYMYRNLCGIDKKILNTKSDKISMYLNLLYAFFPGCRKFPTVYEYDKKSEYYPFLKSSRSVFLDVINSIDFYPDVPYLYELISSGNKMLKKNKKITCNQSENIIY